MKLEWKVSIFIDTRSLPSQLMNRVILPIFGSKSFYLGMVQRAAEHCRKVPWAAIWVQSGVVWASTRAKPISDRKPSWPVFGNKGENNRWTTRLSHYGPQIVYPSISQSYFMRRSHFWSQFAHISSSDGIQNCLRKAKVKNSFCNVSRYCIKIWCFWVQIRNLRAKLRLYGSFMIIVDFYE